MRILLRSDGSRVRKTLRAVATILVSAIALAVGFVVLFTTGFIWGYRNLTPARPAALLAIDPRDLDFGTVYAQRAFNWKVTLRNTSAYAVAIDDVRVSCNCTSVSPKSCLIPVGGKQDFTFTIDTTRRTGSSALGPRDFAISFLPVINGAMPFADMIKLRGRVIDPIFSLPDFITYGGMESIVAGTQAPSRLVTVRLRDSRLDGTLLASCNPRIGYVTNPQRIDAGWQLTFTPSVMTDLASFEDVIDLRLVAFDGVERIRSSIPVAGCVTSVVEATPSLLVIPPVVDRLAITGECHLSLRSHDAIAAPPTITCDHPSLKAEFIASHFPGKTASFRIFGAAHVSEPNHATITVHLMTSTGDTHTREINASWHVLDAPSTSTKGNGDD